MTEQPETTAQPAEPRSRDDEAPATESPRSIKGKSATTEFFFAGEPDPGRMTLVFHHIPKTAGTALRRLIRANLPDTERVQMPERPDSSARDALLAWYASRYESYPAERRRLLACVMSHSAGFVLPALEHPAEQIILVREPVDRVLSHYHVHRKRQDRKPGREPTELEAIYERWSGRAPAGGAHALPAVGHYFNGQSRWLLSVGYDVSELPYSPEPPDDADVWRSRLFRIVDETRLVGVQDRFPELAELLARTLGWNAHVPWAKVNRTRPPLSELEDPLRDVILAHNWLDLELHGRISARITSEQDQVTASRP